jgi:hypothetical protein
MGAMGSSAGARALLVLGFLAAWVGYDAWLVSHVILDPASTRAAAHALLETPAVRQSLADQLVTEVDRRIPLAAEDPRLAPAVTAALHDPRVVAAFTNTVANIHEAILSHGNQTTFTVDGRALSLALRNALAARDPLLAARVKKVPPLTIRIRNDNLPRVHALRSAADGVMVLATVAALLLIAASLLLRHDRGSFVLVGRRAAYLAITPLLLFVVLPRVLEHASGIIPDIATTLLRTYGHRALPSAIALVVVGALIVLAALAWPRNQFDDQAGGSPAPYQGPAPFQGPLPPGGPGGPARTGLEIGERLYL